MSEANQDLKTYTARCHCNNTIFEVTIPALESGATVVNQCNCSICTKSGYQLVYPLSKEVKFLKGESALKDYFFATKTRAHKFCPECGTSILIDFKDVDYKPLKGRYGISIRTFDNIEDLIKEGKVTFESTDGKNELKPAYQALAGL